MKKLPAPAGATGRACPAAALALLLFMLPGCASASTPGAAEGGDVCLDLRGERYCLPGEVVQTTDAEEGKLTGALTKLSLPTLESRACNFPAFDPSRAALLIRESFAEDESPHALIERSAEAWTSIYQAGREGLPDVLGWCARPGNLVCSYTRYRGYEVFTTCSEATADDVKWVCRSTASARTHRLQLSFSKDCFPVHRALIREAIDWFQLKKVG